MGNILDYNNFKESNSTPIRVSCAGLASILIDGKYLLVQNKKSRDKGVISYGPLGGALEYDLVAQDFLNVFVKSYERKTPDLRFITTEDKIPRFTQWFEQRIDREISCKRELIEELVDEEKILKVLLESNIYEKEPKLIRDKSIKPEIDGEIMTERFFEVFEIQFDEWTTQKLKDVAEQEDSTIGLFTKEEILQRGLVSKHSQFIIR